MSENLVYVGKIVDIQPIQNADFIVSATVVCGKGGKWRGVVTKDIYHLGDLCVVFLPDSQLNETDHFFVSFMKDTSWRVKMRRFRGSPSEVLITSCVCGMYFNVDQFEVGQDLTTAFKVIKYHKPIPANMQGKALGEFPGFIPKTDEPNYQTCQDLIDLLVGKPYYISEKCDGSSTTAYKYKGHFGVCSRNWELERDNKNGYWEIAMRYDLENKLPEGTAIQWETCGPKIQGNPMGLKQIEGYLFSGYNIHEHRYLNLDELVKLSNELNFPMARCLGTGTSFKYEEIETLGEGKYANGKNREGVVIRSQYNITINGKPISFKVINLDYEK